MRYERRLAKASPEGYAQDVKQKTFAAPSRGWIANESLMAAVPGGAAALENWFPIATGCRLRGGTFLWSQIGDGDHDVTSLISYVAGPVKKLFAATSESITDITTQSFSYVLVDESGEILSTETGEFIGADTSSSIAGLAAGNWIGVQYTNSGGTFLRLVNGANTPLVYDGSTFSTSPAITGSGLTPTTLSYVWVYNNRVFYIQKGTLNVWYHTSVDAIGGAAALFPLGGVFRLGGELVFGATWSVGDGGGLNDNCVFVTSEGEVAVYRGTDPGSVATWSKVALYRIGRPLGPQCFFRSGGDLIIATDIGMIPLSQAISKSYEEIAPGAVSYPIETAWNEAVDKRTGLEWVAEVWPRKQMMVVALPTPTGGGDEFFVANVRSGAWCKFTGLKGTCVRHHDGEFYFGSSGGRIFRLETTGADDGVPYTGLMVPLFDDMGSATSVKTPSSAKAFFMAESDPAAKVSVSFDYEVTPPAVPPAFVETANSVWGSVVCGQTKFGAKHSIKKFVTDKGLNGSGYVLAPCVQVTSGGLVAPNVELARVEVLFDSGQIAA